MSLAILKHFFYSLQNSTNVLGQIRCLVTFRMSHLLHGSGSNHDRHGDLEPQDGCCHINLAHINQNPRPEAVKNISQGILYIKSHLL